MLRIFIHPQIRVDDALIVLNFRRDARRDLLAEVNDVNPVGDVHDEVHVVLDEEDGQAEFVAHAADEVGQPRVMAAVLADIVVIKKKRGNDRAVAAASQVRAGGHADHQRDGSRGQFVHKYPPN